MNRFVVSVLVLASFVGCSQTAPRSAGDMTMMQRIMKTDENKTSPYEKAFNTAGAGDRGVGSMLGRKSAKGRDFGGLKSVQAGSFKTGEFTNGKSDFTPDLKKSPFGNDTSRLGRSSVSARESSAGAFGSKEGSQMFSGADDVVRGKFYRPGQKSILENKRPVVSIDPSAEPEKVAYTEDEIKRLLGR